MSERPDFLLYERVGWRLIIENTSDVPQAGSHWLIHDPQGPLSSLTFTGPGQPKLLWSVTRCGIDNPRTLAPHGVIKVEYLGRHLIEQPGQYRVRASYHWSARSASENDFLEAETTIDVRAPDGVDLEALRWAGSPHQLMELEEPSLAIMSSVIVREPGQNDEVWYECVDDSIRLADEGAQARRRVFLEKFPSSRYASSVLFAMAMSFKDRKRWEEAIAAFRTFGAAYPRSWFVPEAMLHTVEAQLGLGRSREAAATLRELLARREVGDAVLDKARRLQRGLDDGDTTLDDIP